jgi:hypothetical protein
MKKTKKPREWWLVWHKGDPRPMSAIREHVDPCTAKGCTVVHVREVLPAKGKGGRK